MNGPAPRWWIEADGRLWGPYPTERLQRFRAEGRLGASTLVSPDSAGPFAPAALAPDLAHLFPEAAEPVCEPVAATPRTRPLLVITDAEETGRPALEAALAAHGELVGVRPGVWLVRAREGAAALRNALSRRMRGGDALLVIEAPLEAAAWFNLDGAADRALRRLWAEPPLATESRPASARSPS